MTDKTALVTAHRDLKIAEKRYLESFDSIRFPFWVQLLLELIAGALELLITKRGSIRKVPPMKARHFGRHVINIPFYLKCVFWLIGLIRKVIAFQKERNKD